MLGITWVYEFHDAHARLGVRDAERHVLYDILFHKIYALNAIEIKALQTAPALVLVSII